MMQKGDAISDQQVHVVAVNDDNNIQALIKAIRGVINETGSSETDSNIIQIAGKVMDQTGGK